MARGKAPDLTGKRFGRLTVLACDGYTERRHVMWRCRCECGKVKSIQAGSLTTGRTTSCGCYRREVVARNSVRSSNGGIGCRLRRTVDETMAETFATDPRVLLRRIGIRTP